MLKSWNPLKPGHSGNNLLNYWLNGEKRPNLAVPEIPGYGENVLEAVVPTTGVRRQFLTQTVIQDFP